MVQHSAHQNIVEICSVFQKLICKRHKMKFALFAVALPRVIDVFSIGIQSDVLRSGKPLGNVPWSASHIENPHSIVQADMILQAAFASPNTPYNPLKCEITQRNIKKAHNV